jgi:CRISPR-associated protein Cas5d
VAALASTGKAAVFAEEKRQQRAAKVLKDVKYRIFARLEFIPPKDRKGQSKPTEYRSDENPGKYQGMFERRAKKGQVFNHPYLGCREFSCSTVRLIENVSREQRPIDDTREFGYMLYDMDFSDLESPMPAFFEASLKNGVMEIPPWGSGKVRI